MLAGIIALLSAAAAASSEPTAEPLRHFLMIASDDMRPEMSPYGHEYMHTPNFQRLADDGFVFRRAYVQQVSAQYFVLRVFGCGHCVLPPAHAAHAAHCPDPPST